mmetsp:Transcript_20338/g.57222  ORF Transcript_20338/g.57222 Transcript_20338/m.57222 type:complete len:317 (+) Transcript_20338:80-1030(+)
MAPMSRAAPLLALAAWPCGCLRHLDRSNLNNNTDTDPDAFEGSRYMFVAGMVGSGLEYWSNIWMDCIEAKVCEKRDSSFYTAVMFQQGSEAEFTKSWASHRPKNGKVVPMNLVTIGEHVGKSGFVHPFSGGEELKEGNDDPRLNLYAKVAEKLGDTFKAIIVTRNEKDLLANVRRTLLDKTKDKTHAQVSGAEQIAVDITNTLASQVRELPKGSYRCMRFEDLQTLGFHFQPVLKREQEETEDFSRDAFAEAKEVSPGCKKPSECKPASKLREALDKLETLCDQNDLGPPATEGKTMKQLKAREGVYASMTRWILS